MTLETYIQIANLLLTFTIGIVLAIYFSREKNRKEQKSKLSENYLKLELEIYPYLKLLDKEPDYYIVNSVFYHINHSLRLKDKEMYDYYYEKKEKLIEIENNVKSTFKLKKIIDSDKIMSVGQSLDNILFTLNKNEHGKIGFKSMELLGLLQNYRNSMHNAFFEEYDFKELDSIIIAHKNQLLEDFEVEDGIINFISDKRTNSLFSGQLVRNELSDKSKELLDLIKSRIIYK